MGQEFDPNANEIDFRFRESEIGDVTPLSAWGKFAPHRAPRTHPLVDHMLDVAACFLSISRTPAVDRALCRLAGWTSPLPEVFRWRLAALAFLHDFGKANAGFQVKQFDHVPAGWPRPCGHVDECLLVFAPDHPFFAQLDELLPLQEICSWGDESVGQNLLLASISHHGRPVQEPNSALTQRQIWAPVFAPDGALIYEPAAAVAQMGQALRQHFAPAFVSADAAPPWPDQPAFVHLFAGLVQLADWLGSDTRFFPFTAPGEERGQTVWQRAQDAVHAIGLDPTAARAALKNHALSFEQVFKVPSARPLQRVLGQPRQGALLILESETGSGKTEAALWHRTAPSPSGQWLATQAWTTQRRKPACPISASCGPTNPTSKPPTGAGRRNPLNDSWLHRWRWARWTRR